MIRREDYAVHFLGLEPLWVPCDNVAAKAGGKGSAEGGGRPGARLLEVWRDGGGVREDIACDAPWVPQERKQIVTIVERGLKGVNGTCR